MSQNALILAALQQGRRLTKLDALKMGAGLSINSRVAELRAQGHQIECERVERDGRVVYEYSLAGQLELI